MQKQTVQLQHTQKKNKSFHENISVACFLCEMTAAHHCKPTGMRREVKHIFKKLEKRLRSERCNPVGSGSTLCCLFECTDWS